MAKTFKDVNGFEIAFDQVTFIQCVDGKQKICTRKTAFTGKALYEVSAEVAIEIRAMFAAEADKYMAQLDGATSLLADATAALIANPAEPVAARAQIVIARAKLAELKGKPAFKIVPYIDLQVGNVVHFHGARFLITDTRLDPQGAAHIAQYGVISDTMVAHGTWLDGEIVNGYFGPNTPWTFQGNKGATAQIEVVA